MIVLYPNPMDLLDREMLTYEIIRNNDSIDIIKAYKNPSAKYFMVYPDTELLEVDVLNESNTGIKFYITSIDSSSLRGHVYGKKAKYITSAEYNAEVQKNNNSPIYNFGNVSNSIIGSQTNASINIGMDVEQFRALINQKGEDDKEILHELADALQEITKSETVKKGSLQKFGDVIAKHSWVIDSVAKIIMRLLIG